MTRHIHFSTESGSTIESPGEKQGASNSIAELLKNMTQQSMSKQQM